MIKSKTKTKRAVTPSAGTTDGDLMTIQSAAVFLGVSTQWLKKRRARKKAPVYLHLSHRMIRYRKADLVAFLDGAVVVPDGRPA